MAALQVYVKNGNCHLATVAKFGSRQFFKWWQLSVSLSIFTDGSWGKLVTVRLSGSCHLVKVAGLKKSLDLSPTDKSYHFCNLVSFFLQNLANKPGLWEQMWAYLMLLLIILFLYYDQQMTAVIFIIYLTTVKLSLAKNVVYLWKP